MKTARWATAKERKYQRLYREKNREAIAEYQKRYRQENREAIAKQLHEYYEQHREAKAEQNRRHYEKDRKAAAERTRKWREKNPEAYREWREKHREVLTETVRRFRKKNPGAGAEAAQRWRNKNPEAVRSFNRNRKALKKGAEGKYTAVDIKVIWKRQRHKCAVPNCPYPIASSGKHIYHVDHVVALINGGSNSPSNLQILCATHNLQKKDKDELKWANSHGLLFV